ncbi:heterokaryon incompatibility protein-domain-containing protein [Cercophora newfieldiana]|uniref:Heterokaryon incompatibility protein-domain-containing protein n=1 Tax=Cercophora newfieldiana TaxID=92897 RepID=A0AA39YEZ4_9PEZI|nr:heterokaryon incompatibility protein-domain-containing protein [Cercophora newfieldiana]
MESAYGGLGASTGYRRRSSLIDSLPATWNLALNIVKSSSSVSKPGWRRFVYEKPSSLAVPARMETSCENSPASRDSGGQDNVSLQQVARAFPTTSLLRQQPPAPAPSAQNVRLPRGANMEELGSHLTTSGITMSRSEMPSLKYNSLTTPTSIRLLEILPVPGDDIHCSLTAADLEDDPIFDALSYTWGNPITIREEPRTRDFEIALQKYLDDPTPSPKPGRSVHIDLDAWRFRHQHKFTPYEKVDWDAERRCRLICNGEVVMVTANLIDALHQVRRRLHFSPERNAEFEAMNGSPMSRYLWVDMVCINQDDVHERNGQIRIMGRIFESAKTVFGWLGAEANLSRHAGHAISHFLDKLLKMKEVDDIDTVLPPSLKALFSVDGIQEVDVYAIFALFQRLWFRRAWIIQEVVLAQKLVLVCGGVMLQWGSVELFVSVLHSRNLYRSLSTFGIGVMSGKPTYKDGKQDLKAGAESIFSVVGDSSSTLWNGVLQVDPLETQQFMLGVGAMRRFFGRPTLNYAETKHGKGVVEQPRHTDEDDGVTANASIDEKTQHAESAARTEKSLQMPSALHETLLHLCRSCSATDPRDKIFSMFGILQKTGSQLPEIPWDYQTSVQQLYRATVLAIIRSTNRLDVLAQVQDPSRTNLPGLPSWVPDFSVGLGAAQFESPAHPFFSASGSDSHCTIPSAVIALRLPVEGYFVDNIIDLAALRGCYFIRTAKIVSRLPPRYHPKQRCNEMTLTRSHAYWRTLVGELLRDDTPAMTKMGFGFSEWLTEELVRAYKKKRRRKTLQEEQHAKGKVHVEPPSVQAYFERLDEKFQLWMALMQGEPEDYVHIDTATDKEVYVDAQTPLRFIPDWAMIANSYSRLRPLSGELLEGRLRCSYG